MKKFVLSVLFAVLFLSFVAPAAEAGLFRRAAHGVKKAAGKVVPNRCCGRGCRCN